MKKCKLCSLLMVAVMAVSLFAGCGDAKENNGAAGMKGTSAVSETEKDHIDAETETAVAETENAKVTLTILWGQSAYDAGVEDMIDAAMAEHYPDIEIEWECVDWETDFHAKMEQYLESGLPDIIIGKPQDVAKYYGLGVLGEIDSIYTDRAVDGATENLSFEGAAYGMPINVIYHGIFYNKDIFAENDWLLPETMRDIYRINSEANERGIISMASHMVDTSAIMNITMQGMVNEVFLYEPDWGDQLRAGKVSYMDEYGPQYSYNYNQLVVCDYSFEDVLSIDERTCDERFVNGEAAMKVSGSWSVRSFLEINPDFEFGFFAFPNQQGDHKLIYEPDITIMLNKDTVKQDEVKAFLDVMTGDKELLVEIADFTMSDSLIAGVEPTFVNPCQADIDAYLSAGKVIDATIFNNQLAWDTFQKENAADVAAWLRGEVTFRDCLLNSDARAAESAIN